MTVKDASTPQRSVGTIAAVRTGPTRMKILRFKLPNSDPRQKGRDSTGGGMSSPFPRFFNPLT